MMKRVLVFLGILLIAPVLLAQEDGPYQFEDLVVKAPVYNGVVEKENGEIKTLNEVVVDHLLDQVNNEYREGTVIIDFVVDEEGELSDYKIRNEVCAYNAKSVIVALKRTSGDWIPGKKDGLPFAMERRVVVGFDDPNTPTLKESAIYFTNKGVQCYMQAHCLKKDLFSSQAQREVRIKRKIKSALRNLETAERFQPNEESVLFWQAKAYDEIGDYIKRDKKLLELDYMTGNAYSTQTSVINFEIYKR